MTRDTKDDDMIYGLTVEERGRLKRGLGELEGTMPPRAVWNRICEQAEAEGLIRTPHDGRRRTWFGITGLAAALLLAAIVVPGLRDATQQPYPVVPDNAEPSNSVPLTALEALMVESRQLENDLRSLPGEPRVIRAGTQATILEIEDRIAAIDYQLNEAEPGLAPDEEEIFWRERVRLMNSLLRLREAQAQRTAY